MDEGEVEGLAKWLLKNREIQQVWPVNVITERVAQVLRDGVADQEELDDLRTLFEQLTGPEPDRFLCSPAATRLPLTAPPPVLKFADRVFVLTGKFLYGTRRVCERAVTDRGGTCEPRVTLRTHFLVIGILGSEDWVHSTHGRKIEQAVAYAQQGRQIAIISEEHWERCVMGERADTQQS